LALIRVFRHSAPSPAFADALAAYQISIAMILDGFFRVSLNDPRYYFDTVPIESQQWRKPFSACQNNIHTSLG
jgi:hypothetical protein